MQRDMIQRALQIIYGCFYDTAGTWPSLADLQRMLNRQSKKRIDAYEIARRLPSTLLKPLSSDYPAPTEQLILTLEGIQRCVGSVDDTENALDAVKWLAKRAEHQDHDELGVRFTVNQLSDSLSLNSDAPAIRRLIAILKSEEWI